MFLDMFVEHTYNTIYTKPKKPKSNFFSQSTISTLLKKNSTAGKKSTEPEDDDSKADGSNKEKGDGEAEPTTETTPTKKSTKPADKTAETNEAGTDASVKDESDADENNDDEKKSEVDSSKPKTGYKSMQKSYIKLVCVHCNIKCVTFKVNWSIRSNHRNSLIFGSKLSIKKTYRNINIICIVDSINCL